MEFSEWLNNEMQTRGWTQNELARRAGVSQATISMALSRQISPGEKLCIGLSKAFKIPLNEIMKIARIIPMPEEEEYTTTELISEIQTLQIEDKKILLEITKRFKKDYKQ